MAAAGSSAPVTSPAAHRIDGAQASNPAANENLASSSPLSIGRVGGGGETERRRVAMAARGRGGRWRGSVQGRRESLKERAGEGSGPSGVTMTAASPEELPGGCPAASLLALARMLGGGAPEEEEEEEASPPPPSVSRAGPGSLGPAKAPADPSGGGGGARTLVKAGEHQGIWTPEEVPEGPEYEDPWEAREQPEYEILFKQQVGAEDVFLGMSRKDPSTACCEDLLIKIKLPDTKASDITLDICEKVLDLRSPQKKLLLHLPHPVDTQSGKACFLSEQGLLEVTLRMRRELDFLNFA